MRKRHLLGQHTLTSQAVARKIVESAGITKKDIVLEIGTGKGILVPLLCKKAKKVISFEIDSTLFNEARQKFLDLSNLKLVHADGFKSDQKFSIFVSNLPYSKSRKAIEWLAMQNFSHAIIMIQKEFAEKLSQTEKKKRAISVITKYCFKINHVINVNKKNFIPNPKVDSVVLKLTQKEKLTVEEIKKINLLFSFKRKKIQTILNKYGIQIKSDNRLEDLRAEEIVKIAKKIIK